MLTKHQLLHLNQIIKDGKEEGNIKAVNSANEIIKTGIFPDLKSDCEIHDFLEKDLEGNKWQTL